MRIAFLLLVIYIGFCCAVPSSQPKLIRPTRRQENVESKAFLEEQFERENDSDQSHTAERDPPSSDGQVKIVDYPTCIKGCDQKVRKTQSDEGSGRLAWKLTTVQYQKYIRINSNPQYTKDQFMSTCEFVCWEIWGEFAEQDFEPGIQVDETWERRLGRWTASWFSNTGTAASQSSTAWFSGALATVLAYFGRSWSPSYGV